MMTNINTENLMIQIAEQAEALDDDTLCARIYMLAQQVDLTPIEVPWNPRNGEGYNKTLLDIHINEANKRPVFDGIWNKEER